MLTMVLTGDCCTLEAFVTHLKTQAFMKVVAEHRTKLGEIELQFTTNVLKPTLLRVSDEVLETTDGNTIRIELLHPMETRVDEHTRQITGSLGDLVKVSRYFCDRRCSIAWRDQFSPAIKGTTKMFRQRESKCIFRKRF
jgi:hypothetical protein